LEKDRKQVKKAAALSYDLEQDSAPVMVAMGQGKVAERIIETAEEHDIPVVPDENLANMLSQLSVGDAIPPELYGIVAEILVFVSTVDEDFAKKNRMGRYRPAGG
jgi:flagellar biosynthesis protein